MKKLFIIGIAAWILAPYLHAFQIGATIGTGIGAAKAFTGFAEAATTILLWLAFIAFVLICLVSIFGGKRKKKSTRYLDQGQHNGSHHNGNHYSNGRR